MIGTEFMTGAAFGILFMACCWAAWELAKVARDF